MKGHATLAYTCALSIAKFPSTRESISLLEKVLKALAGGLAIGSPLSTTGTVDGRRHTVDREDPAARVILSPLFRLLSTVYRIKFRRKRIKFLAASTRAIQPGGTTVVELYSATTAGPANRVNGRSRSRA